MSFGPGATPSASSEASSQSGAIYTGAIAAPVVNLVPPTSPGEISPAFLGAAAVLVVFIGVVLYMTRRK